MTPTCALCQRPIEPYDPSMSRLELDGGRAADLCPACIDRFLRWQQDVFARLFPTAAMKKRRRRP